MYTTSVTIDDKEYEVELSYSIFGRYKRATYYSPPEHPQVDWKIERVDDCTDSEVYRAIESALMKRNIEDEILAYEAELREQRDAEYRFNLIREGL